MVDMTWPENLFDLVFMPHRDEQLDRLANLAEPEDWDYRNTPSEYEKPVLYGYLRNTYQRLAEEEKITVADDGQSIVFNTGLVTPSQEPIFAYCTHNHLPDRNEPWHFHAWRRKGEYDLTRFSSLPTIARYFEDASALVFDTRKELRVNVEHIVKDHKDRFPEPYRNIDDHQVQTFLKGAIDNAKERVKRNYKTAVPQHYHGRIQLLLPICISNPSTADLALVVSSHGAFYRASTCLTLDMAYNNARLLARPDKDWLQP